MMNTSNWVVSGKKPGEPPTIGQRYKVVHCRKGTFFGTVQSVHGEWAEVLIDDGEADAIFQENVRVAGEVVTVRDVLARFVPSSKS